VLRIHKLGPGGHAYYLEASRTEGRGTWIGAGLGALGIETGREALDEAAFSELVGATGSPRARAARQVAGFDLTFAAPKSVSLCYALGEPDVAEAALASHEGALRAALDYLERRAVGIRRRSGGERRVEPIEGLAGAAFLHRTSRALDPHLHTHVVVANLAADAGGRRYALDARGLYAHASSADALYHTELRRRLAATLGVRFGPLRSGRADLEGIDRRLIEAFSSRRRQIEAELDRHGRHSLRAAAIAAASTRPPRQAGPSFEELVDAWRDRARRLGAPSMLVADAYRRGPALGWPAARRVEAQPIANGQRTELAALDALFGRAAGGPIARRHALRVVASVLRQGGEVGRLERVVDAALGLGPDDAGRVGVTERRIDGAELVRHRIAARRRVIEVLARDDAAERARALAYGLGAPERSRLAPTRALEHGR
jgi:conjugative relaxase-like TrwC/TraI family protein